MISPLPSLPLLRWGTPYESLDRMRLDHLGTGEPVAEVSQANPGLVARDLAAPPCRGRLDSLSAAELVEIASRAGRLFLEAALPLGRGEQTPDDYVRQLSATTGLPQRLARANMDKAAFVLGHMEDVLGGLTRGLSLEAIDRGWVEEEGRLVSYRRETDVLGAVLPSNSPGVHSLWLPAIPLKVGLALRPGSREPWTPFRLAQAFVAAGCPPEAFGFYPSGYGGAGEILLRAGRSLLYGDRATVDPWRHDPRVQVHGPGWSKVLLGPDQAGRWLEHLDLIAASVAENGGRSCTNASGVWTLAGGEALARGLAERLGELEPRALDDPEAELAAMPSVAAAERLSRYLDERLAVPGARDVSAEIGAGGSGERVVVIDGCAFLRPTVVLCDRPEHPLARTELLFPFVAVVEVPEEELLPTLGDTLVLTALTEDAALRRALLRAGTIERLNLAFVPTTRVAWDQPHEGNLFEHLYRQRALSLDVA